MLQTTVRIFTKGLVVVVLLALTLGFFTRPASAHTFSNLHPSTAPCWKTTCYGKDPYSLGCANSIHEVSQVVKNSSGVSIAKVWNDFSYTCDANWTQGQRLSNNYAGIWISIQAIDSNNPPKNETQCYPETLDCVDPGPYYTGTAIAWTNMVDGTNTAGACVVLPIPNSQNTISGCISQ